VIDGYIIVNQSNGSALPRLKFEFNTTVQSSELYISQDRTA